MLLLFTNTIIMYDFFSKALILDREPLGETDSYIHLLTAEYGKLSAKAKSLRKITSKLSSHLEPNSISLIRFVGKKGLHIADALKLHKKNYSWNILNLLKKTVPEWHRDINLWDNVLKGSVEEKRLLSHLGFNISFSSCYFCQIKNPEFFFLKDHYFVCRSCSSSFQIPEDDVVLIT